MREFVILQHNKNKLIRRSIIFLGMVCSITIMPSLDVNAFVVFAPVGLVIVGSIIHHIYFENYKEVGEFTFSEDGISILDYKSEETSLIPISDLKRILIFYHGYYGEERNTYSSNYSVDFGDNNFIQIETGTERLRYCFYGNDSEDANHLNEWSAYFSIHSIEMKPSKYIQHPRFIRRLFDKPLSNTQPH